MAGGLEEVIFHLFFNYLLWAHGRRHAGFGICSFGKTMSSKKRGILSFVNFGEGPERFAHLAHQKRENEQIFKKLTKTLLKTYKQI